MALVVVIDTISRNSHFILEEPVRGMPRSEAVIAILDAMGIRYNGIRTEHGKQMNMKHLPHETRHTCISRLVVAGVNQTIIKKIVGHKSIMNLTEKGLHAY